MSNLYTAILKNDKETIKSLLENGADPNLKYGNTDTLSDFVAYLYYEVADLFNNYTSDFNIYSFNSGLFGENIENDYDQDWQR